MKFLLLLFLIPSLAQAYWVKEDDVGKESNYKTFGRKAVCEKDGDKCFQFDPKQGESSSVYKVTGLPFFETIELDQDKVNARATKVTQKNARKTKRQNFNPANLQDAKVKKILIEMAKEYLENKDKDPDDFQ